MARLYDFYKDTVVPELMKQFGYKSIMQVPRIEKITVNMGVGEAVADKKVMDFAVGDLERSPARSRLSPPLANPSQASRFVITIR